MVAPHSVKLTARDLDYLYGPKEYDPWVPAIEVELARSADDTALRRALSVSMRAHPRFSARLRDRHWVPAASADDVPIVHPAGDDEASWETVRATVADAAFVTDVRAPVRVGLDRRRLIVGWWHAVCDGAGGVAFVSSLLKALGGDIEAYRVEPEDRSTEPRVWSTAVRPRVAREVLRKRRERGERTATFRIDGDFGPRSALAVWTLDPAEHADLLGTVRRLDVGLTTALVCAAARACFRCIDADDPVRIGVPVNLRPRRSPREPSGNFVGQGELSFDAPPALAAVNADYARAIGPAARATLWALAARCLVPESIRARRGSDDPDSARLGRTLFVNNLGVVTAADFPDVERGWWVAPNAVDGPALTIFSIAEVTTLAVRVRIHQGGAELAEHLLQTVRAELSPEALSAPV